MVFTFMGTFWQFLPLPTLFNPAHHSAGLECQALCYSRPVAVSRNREVDERAGCGVTPKKSFYSHFSCSQTPLSWMKVILEVHCHA